MLVIDEETSVISTTKEERDMAMLIHVLSLVAGFVGPLVLWLVKRNDSKFVDRHGKSCLNMEITFVLAVLVVYLALFVPMFVFGLNSNALLSDNPTPFVITIIIMVVLLFVMILLRFIFPIFAAMKASRGEEYHYPLSIRFIK